MAFDAKAHAEALERPAFTDLDGRTHVGVILSTPEVITMQAVQDRLPDDPTPEQTRRFVRWAVEQWFPPRWWERLLGRPSPALRAFLQLPEATQAEALRSFTRSQRSAMPRRHAATADAEPLGATTTT